MNKVNAIGICGLARSGKDSFFSITNDILSNMGFDSYKVSFADALKHDVKDFLFEKTGINSFTEIDEEKVIIRDFLVAYGTKLMRKINENCWIEKVDVETRIQIYGGRIPIFTDVRYLNELNWVKNELGGCIIHVSKIGNTPPNEEEAINDPILLKNSDVEFEWGEFKNNKPTFQELDQIHHLIDQLTKHRLVRV